MTEETPETAATEPEKAAEPPKHWITVRGQQVEIGGSNAGQLAMINLTARRMARLDLNNTTNAQAVDLYQKVIQIVTSIMVSRDDKDWVEDLLIQKDMLIDEAIEIMSQATDEWAKDGNREQRRATKKTATRKKASASKK